MRVLCTCLPGYGHFLPMVPLARALAAGGHTVVFATADAFTARVTAAGFEARPAGLSLPEQLRGAAAAYPAEHALPFGKERFHRFVPRMLAGVAAGPRAADLRGVLDDLRPDVLVHDETDFGGPVAAAAAGTPYAGHSVGFLRPLHMARVATDVLRPLWDDWGVDLGSYGGLFRYLYLDVCPPSLQSPEIALVDVAHPMRNTDLATGADGLPAWIDELRDVPTVYVSLGTIFDGGRDVFTGVLGGLAALDVDVIVTVGNQNDPGELGPQPPNVHVERFIPQELLLPYCDAVVNQGGTAILPILAAGLPLLVLPQRANQFHNAEACVRAGVARTLLPAQISPGAVRDAVDALLTEPSYRLRSAGVADELARMPGPERAVGLLEQLAEGRAPLPGPAAA